MAVVHRAEHLETGKHVALKLLTVGPKAPGESTWEADRQLLGRFKREARAAGSIETEHIVEVFDAGIDPATGAPYIVMELLDGCDLEALLGERGALPVDLALRLCGQTLTGLAAAHEWGVVHRDIKPANLFLARDAHGAIRVKILDFGIAKAKSSPDRATHALTEPGSLLGTPRYMAPEQLERPDEVDARADVWSMGAVLRRCLTGEPLYADCATVGSLMAALLTRTVDPVSLAAPWVSPEVAALVDRALGRQPRARFASAGVMLEALQALCPRGFAIQARDLRALDPGRTQELRGRSALARVRPAPTAAVTSSPAPAPAPARGRHGDYLGYAAAAGVSAIVVLLLSGARGGSSAQPVASWNTAVAAASTPLVATNVTPASSVSPRPLPDVRRLRLSPGYRLSPPTENTPANAGHVGTATEFKNPALGF
jgi:serine/threonine-protein kinase